MSLEVEAPKRSLLQRVPVFDGEGGQLAGYVGETAPHAAWFRVSQRLRKGRSDETGNRQLHRATPHGPSWRAWIAPAECDPTFDNLVTEVEGLNRPRAAAAARTPVTVGSREARTGSSGFHDA